MNREYIVNAYTKLESFFSSVLFAFGMIVLIGFVFFLMFSCNHKSGKKDFTREMAAESLRLKVDRPESLKILGYSELDSVFGKSYFNEAELMQIAESLTEFNSSAWGDGGLMDQAMNDPKKMARIQRAANAADLIRNLFDFGQQSGSKEFSGWKMKVLYESTDTFDQPVKGEHYFIFDKERKFILHSFDIPIL